MLKHSPKRPSLLLAVVAVLAFLAAILPGLSAETAEAQTQANSKVPQRIWDAVAAGESVELVLSGASSGDIQRASRQSLNAGGEELVIGERFEKIDAVTTQVDSLEQLTAVANSVGVTAVSLGSERATRHLREAIAIVGADTAHNANLMGAGTTIALVDGGVESSHPDLASSVTFEACFIRDPDDGTGYCPGGLTQAEGTGTAPDDSYSHGTFIAGIMVSDGVLAPMGFAPQADLEVFKVFEEDDGGFLTDLLRSLTFIAANRPHTDVVNLSFSFASIHADTCNDDYQSLYDAVEAVRANGTIVVVATGNAGLETIGAPACLSNVITVASSHDVPDEPEFGSITDFSNLSSEVDLVAPGTKIETTSIGSGIALVGGTSFSAPVVAGCAALMREAGLETARAVETRLLDTNTLAPNDRGYEIPIVDCDFSGFASGDANCDGAINVVDGLVIAQYVVGNLDGVTSCPLEANQINMSAVDINHDDSETIVDALLVVQCAVEIETDYC